MTPTEIRAYCRRRRYSREYADYWAAHTICEACESSPSGAPHHIRSRGAHGNIDEPWNLLGLCQWCHRNLHIQGHGHFVYWYPDLVEKVAAAIDKAIP